MYNLTVLAATDNITMTSLVGSRSAIRYFQLACWPASDKVSKQIYQQSLVKLAVCGNVTTAEAAEKFFTMCV